MPITAVVELIDELELMVGTINTDHKDYEGSIEELCFKEHQANIMKLKKCFLKYTTMQTALRQIKDCAAISGSPFNSVFNIARIALDN